MQSFRLSASFLRSGYNFIVKIPFFMQKYPCFGFKKQLRLKFRDKNLQGNG